MQRYALEMSNVLKMSQKEALVNAKFYGMTGISGNMIILTVLQAYSYLYTLGKSFLQSNVSPLMRKV